MNAKKEKKWLYILVFAIILFEVIFRGVTGSDNNWMIDDHFGIYFFCMMGVMYVLKYTSFFRRLDKPAKRYLAVATVLAFVAIFVYTLIHYDAAVSSLWELAAVVLWIPVAYLTDYKVDIEREKS